MKIFANGLSGNLGQLFWPLLNNWDAWRISSRPDANALYHNLRHNDLGITANFSTGDIFLFLAAISQPDKCAANPDLAWKINVENTTALIEAALNKNVKVIFFSSDAVYGHQKGNLSENAKLLARDPYGLMKKAVEEKFRFSPGFSSLRLSYVIHEHDPVTNYFQKCVQQKICASVYSEYARNMVWIGDVIAILKVLLKLAQKGEALPKAINIAGSDCINRAEMAQIFHQNVKSDFQFATAQAPEDFFKTRPKTIALDISLMKKILGRAPLPLAEAYAKEFSQVN